VADVRHELEERLAELGAFIRNQREVARMSVRRLAELADVSNPYLSQIERGLRKPSADILQQIAEALQISAESLYVRAGILDPDREMVVSVVEAIRRDPHLDAEQKRTLLRVYESLRAQAASTGHEGADEPGGHRREENRRADEPGGHRREENRRADEPGGHR
jgi:transcriptional regulator with XRE-family HTH domain